jgi:hypothetical protein
MVTEGRVVLMITAPLFRNFLTCLLLATAVTALAASLVNARRVPGALQLDSGPPGRGLRASGDTNPTSRVPLPVSGA